MTALTIGMATYNDFDGVYFTVQSLRLHQDLADTEILVVDNFGCDHTRDFLRSVENSRYLLATDVTGTAAPRDRVFREAAGEAVLCLDSHVVLVPGAIARLKAYFRDHPVTLDLLQGPLLGDDLGTYSSHFDPVWREQMWGVWATDPRGEDPEGEPFDIPSQGLGLFACRKDAWLGFNPAFRGFGGEEGYIHEKFRQAGARTLCLPWLRWGHRFARPAGVPYPLTVDDKFRNYVVGHLELGLPLAAPIEHFSEWLSDERMVEVMAELLADPAALDDLDAVPAKAGKAEKAEKQGRKGKERKGKAKQRADDRTPEPPLVSCICPTFNRAPDHLGLIEEAVESFLRQDYPSKELIILNDTPGQELVCDAPGVRVVNVPIRFRTLGEKLNAAVALASGDLIAPWDDDDISLPWRLSRSVAALGDAVYFNPGRHWYWERDWSAPRLSSAVDHNASLFTRAAFATAGRYPAMSSGHDQVLDRALLALPDPVVHPLRGGPPLPDDEVYYLYRWGVSPRHVSIGSFEAGSYREIGERPVTPGRFELRPNWREDYLAVVRRARLAAGEEIGIVGAPQP